MGWSWHHPALRRGRSRARSPKRRPPSTTRGERGRRRSPGPRRSSPPNSVLAAKETVTFSFQNTFTFTRHESNVRLRRRRRRRAGRQMSISQQEPLRARASVAFLPSCRARQVDKPLCPFSTGDLHWAIPHPTFNLLPRSDRRRSIGSERASAKAAHTQWSEEEQKDNTCQGVGTTSSVSEQPRPPSARARETNGKTKQRLDFWLRASEAREIRKTNTTVVLW